MNSKTVKKARKIARQLSMGMPARELLAKKVKAKNGPFMRDQAVNAPRSTRGIYRMLKRMLRAGHSISGLVRQHAEPAKAEVEA